MKPVAVHLLLQLTPRILDAYQNVAQLSLMDAISRYLQIWQALPDFGISYVVVRSELNIHVFFSRMFPFTFRRSRRTGGR